MTRALLVLVAALWTSAAAAQTLPALYDVVGVAAPDALNVRAAPTFDAARVGTLSATARNVEVTALDETGTWGRVNVDETAGWASLRFLALQPKAADERFPVPLACFGTEPFWSLDITDNGTVFQLSGISRHAFRVGDRRRATGRTDRWAVATETAGALGNAVIGTNTCSDGMSDRAYGLTGDILIVDRDGIALYSGCCTLSPP